MAEFKVTTPEGRIVQGHPVERQQVKDDKGKPIIENGQNKTEVFFALAIPKGQETDWKQTPWGQQINMAAMDPEHGYPNGEYQHPSFSWKVDDGDSTIPNKRGNRPCDRDGFPGHWVVKFTTLFDIPCFPADNITDEGRFTAVTKLSNPENYPKTGDYFQVAFSTRGNKPSQSPGVYINPIASIRTRVGAPISGSAGVSASEVASLFGAAPVSAPVSTPPPPVSAPSTGTTPPPPAPPAPAHDMVTPPVMWTYDGRTNTEQGWIEQGWSLEQLQAHAVKS